jgi:acylphosphatase
MRQARASAREGGIMEERDGSQGGGAGGDAPGDAPTTGDEATEAVQVRIEGRVQGVWYRGWTVQQASRLGLNGWVRNRADGSVEALFAGPPPAVAAMLDACWEGPGAARVTRVTPTPTAAPDRPGFFALATR